MKTLTPFGVSDYLPDEAHKYDAIRHKIATSFKAHNFEYIRTPTLEYMESLRPGMGNGLQMSTIRFFDAANEMICLRPDHTTPIARLVSSQMDAYKRPIKLFYQGPVFRRYADAQKELEIFQSGAELIGDHSIDCDAHILDVCASTIKSLGFDDICIDVGHVDFLTNLSKEKKLQLLNKDYIAYGAIPKRGNASMFNSNPYFTDLENTLKTTSCKDDVIFNEGLVRDLSYYTGFVFECFINGFSEPIAFGGRYDSLFGKFGADQPAVGFAINVSLLMEHINDK